MFFNFLVGSINTNFEIVSVFSELALGVNCRNKASFLEKATLLFRDLWEDSSHVFKCKYAHMRPQHRKDCDIGSPRCWFCFLWRDIQCWSESAPAVPGSDRTQHLPPPTPCVCSCEVGTVSLVDRG